MWPASQRFFDTLSRSHEILGRAEILIDGQLALTIDGSDPTLLLAAAKVSVGAGVVRRTATLTITDTAGQLVPVVDKGLLIPRTAEIRLWAGVRYWDWTPIDENAVVVNFPAGGVGGYGLTGYGSDYGDPATATPSDPTVDISTEFVPVFTGPITNLDLTNYPAIGIACSDRMWYCQSPFSQPYTVTGGFTLDDAIEALLAAKVPTNKLDFDLPGTDLTTSLLVYDEQADPSDKLKELATAAGWTLYVDPMGTFVADSEPTLDPLNVAFTYQAGPGGALIRPKLSYDAKNIVNTWVVTGEAAHDQIAAAWAKVTDDDPNSATYVSQPADEQAQFFSLPVLKTDAQCLLVAKTLRARGGGLGDVVSAEIMPNPALEKGDVLQVTGGLLDRLIIADSFDLDLMGGSQDVNARAGTADLSGN